MSHGKPRHKKCRRKDKHPQLLRPPIAREDNPVAGLEPDDANPNLPSASDFFKRFDMSTFLLVQAIESARSEQRRALQEVLEAIS